MAIPLRVFKTSYYHQNIPEAKFWRINFSRVNWDFELKNNIYYRKKEDQDHFKPEYNWVWSPMGVINMHQPEHWGYVYFSSKKAGEQDQFTIPNDEKVKQVLYHLYRKQKDYFQKNKRWANHFKALSVNDFEIEGHKIVKTLEIHQTGWNIAIKSPYTKRLYIIKEDGKIIQQKN